MVRLKTRQPIRWLVLLALFFATLAPSISMALGGNDASRTFWTQLCRAGETELIAIHIDGDAAGPTTDADTIKQGHCLLCVHPSTHPPVHTLSPNATAVFVTRLVIAQAQPTQASITWNIALARAPPFVS